MDSLDPGWVAGGGKWLHLKVYDRWADPPPARWSMSSRLRHQPISLDREDESNKPSTERCSTVVLQVAWVTPSGSVVMLFVKVMVSGRQTSEYCVVVAIFRRHILRGWDLILGTFEGRAGRVTADALQRLITVVQYSDRPFDTVAWSERVEHFRRFEDTRV